MEGGTERSELAGPLAAPSRLGGGAGRSAGTAQLTDLGRPPQEDPDGDIQTLEDILKAKKQKKRAKILEQTYVDVTRYGYRLEAIIRWAAPPLPARPGALGAPLPSQTSCPPLSPALTTANACPRPPVPGEGGLSAAERGGGVNRAPRNWGGLGKGVN